MRVCYQQTTIIHIHIEHFRRTQNTKRTAGTQFSLNWLDLEIRSEIRSHKTYK